MFRTDGSPITSNHLAGTAATAARRRAPLPVLGVVTACLLLFPVRGDPGVVPPVPVLVALYPC